MNATSLHMSVVSGNDIIFISFRLPGALADTCIKASIRGSYLKAEHACAVEAATALL